MPEDMPDDEGVSRTNPAPKTRASARPRAGIQRKSKAEREEYARKEAERLKEREIKESASTVKTTATRSKGATRGGRAAAVVNSVDRAAAPDTGGVFGTSAVQRPQRSKAVDLGVSEALDGGESKPPQATNPVTSTAIVDVEVTETRKTARGRGKAPKVEDAAEEVMPVEDEVDDQPRRDIERIWISSDEEKEEDPITSRKGKQRGVSKTAKPFTGLRPVRAVRNTTEVGEDDKRQALMRNPITDEHTLLDAVTDETQREEPPISTRKDNLSSSEAIKRSAKKSDGRVKDPRVSTETVEERAERLRLQDDVQKMKMAFMYDSDADVNIDGQEEAELGETNQDRMFLFQLPPLVPYLLNRATSEKKTNEAMDVDQVQVKVEDTNTATTAPQAGVVNADVSQKAAEQGKATSTSLPTVYTANADLESRLPEGFVGKLRVHKSGKVSLDWGGTDMEVRYGTEVDFLQDVVYVEEDIPPQSEVNSSDSAGSGVAYALGQIDRKMVLVPDWARLYA